MYVNPYEEQLVYKKHIGGQTIPTHLFTNLPS